jgi:hypothetical protein
MRTGRARESSAGRLRRLGGSGAGGNAPPLWLASARYGGLPLGPALAIAISKEGAALGLPAPVPGL